MRRHSLLGWVAWAVLGTGACSSGPDEPALQYDPPNGVPAPGPPGKGEAGAPGFTVPTDDRPPVQADKPPPAVSGGTLHVTPDGTFAVIADSDRDRIVIVDLMSQSVVATVALEAGDEPGRIAAGEGDEVYVALRGGAAVVTVDVKGGTLVERRAACAGPRGLAYDAPHRELLVACADGRLATLPPTGGAAQSVFIGPDLRDVVINDTGRWLSTFKSAELLELDDQNLVKTRLALPNLAGNQTEVAWRAMADGDHIMVLHQSAQLSPIDVSEDLGASAYGSAPCTGIVRAMVSRVDQQGNTELGVPLGDGTLPVDFDRSARGQVAVAYAGALDRELGFLGKRGFDRGSFSVLGNSFVAPIDIGAGGAPASSEPSIDPGLAGAPGVGDCTFGNTLEEVDSPIIAVRFNPARQSELLLLARVPSQLLIVNLDNWSIRLRIPLGGTPVRDTGHDLFHRDAGNGIACASCHPEGTEDGHTWVFSNFGPRRTQALNTDLAATAPYHWDGALPQVSDLMDEVFVKRMGGAHQTDERLAVLERWLFAQKPLPALRSADDAAARRGRELFESSEVACSSCHGGESLTTSASVRVGTKGNPTFQVPSLLGIAHRAPFMHDGCAPTLAARFDPKCGGTAHGNTAELAQDQIDDLVAYLETL
jgi:mono/diheme cytochrome c family protein